MKLNKAEEFLLELINDNSKGYSQIRRTLGDSIAEMGDTDCSGALISALRYAGFNTGDATYTGNLYPNLIRMGFINVISTINLPTGYGLKKHDIVLRPPTSTRGGHVFMYLGDNKIAQWAGDFDGVKGDSSHRESMVQDYYNANPKYVMRLPQIPLSDGEESVLFDVKLKGNMNLREGASSLSKNISVALKGEVFSIVEVNPSNTWGRIKGTKLWVCITDKYVEKLNPPTKPEESKVTKFRLKGDMNIRHMPNTAGKVVDVIKSNGQTIVEIEEFSKNGAWGRLVNSKNWVCITEKWAEKL